MQRLDFCWTVQPEAVASLGRFPFRNASVTVSFRVELVPLLKILVLRRFSVMVPLRRTMTHWWLWVSRSILLNRAPSLGKLPVFATTFRSFRSLETLVFFKKNLFVRAGAVNKIFICGTQLGIVHRERWWCSRFIGRWKSGCSSLDGGNDEVSDVFWLLSLVAASTLPKFPASTQLERDGLG